MQTIEPEEELFHRNLAEKAEHWTRTDPWPALSAAFAAGLALAILPVTGILLAATRLFLMLLRPLLLIMGAIKLFEQVERRAR